ALDRHAGRADVHEAARPLDRQLHPCLKDDLHAGLQMDLLTRLEGVVHADLLLLVLGDRQRARATELLVAVPVAVKVAIGIKRFLLFAENRFFLPAFPQLFLFFSDEQVCSPPISSFMSFSMTMSTLPGLSLASPWPTVSFRLPSMCSSWCRLTFR